MVQHDANFPVRLPHECPGLIHGGHFAAAVGEINIAHGDGQFTMELDHLIADGARLPGLDRKTLVVGIAGIPAHKIGQRADLGTAEGLRLLSQRGFECYSSVLIAISLIKNPAGRGLGRCETACGVSLADRQQAIAPAFLRVQHLLFSDVDVHTHWLTVCQSGTGPCNQEGQNQSAAGGGQTKIHGEALNQRPWQLRGLSRELGWCGLPVIASEDHRQAALGRYRAFGDAIAFIGILCSRLLHLDVSCSSLGLGALVLHEASHLR